MMLAQGSTLNTSKPVALNTARWWVGGKIGCRGKEHARKHKADDSNDEQEDGPGQVATARRLDGLGWVTTTSRIGLDGQ